MKKKEKAIILFTIFVFALLLSNGSVFADGNQKKLEIVYPVIPGTHTPKVISEGLPEYIEYIFTFSFYIIALIILAVLIYSGIQYFTSFGNPGKLTSAKQGITAGLLGALILLSSYLIFNTINPQLTILVAPDPDLIEPSVSPGIYLCDYEADEIHGLIGKYILPSNTKEQKEEKIKTVLGIKDIIKPEKSNNACYRVNASTNIDFGSFRPDKHTSFVIPKKKNVFTNKTTGELEVKWEYNFGMIFHEKDNRRGESYVGFLYKDKHTAITGFGGTFKSANSVTLFEKNNISSSTVTLYQCLNYNEGGKKNGLCPAGLTGEPDKKSFPVGGNDPVYVSQAELGKLAQTGNNEDGARSITIFPKESCFALLFSDDGQKGNVCNAFSENKGNLAQFNIGKCQSLNFSYTTCALAVDENEQLYDCVPCLKSMMIIKGKLIN